MLPQDMSKHCIHPTINHVDTVDFLVLWSKISTVQDLVSSGTAAESSHRKHRISGLRYRLLFCAHHWVRSNLHLSQKVHCCGPRSFSDLFEPLTSIRELIISASVEHALRLLLDLV